VTKELVKRRLADSFQHRIDICIARGNVVARVFALIDGSILHFKETEA